jgi:hypothetical protein
MQRRAEALSLGAWQRRPELVHRVHSILLRKHELNPHITRAVLAAIGCFLLVSSVELARCPQVVAFVPTKSAATSSTFAADQSPTMPARLIHAAYLSVRQSGFERSVQAAHETETKAILPAVHHPASVSVLASSQPLDHRPANQLTSGTSPDDVLIADTEAQRPESVQVREWIVFTAWEQLQTNSPAVQQASAVAHQSSTPAGSESKTQLHLHQANRITVTRLIFRVVQASSNSTQSIPLPVRDGWFVIQL